MKSSTLKKIITAVVAVIIALAAFGGGYLTRSLLNGGKVNSYKWVLETINNNYFGEFDEDAAAGLSLKAIAAQLDPYSEYYTAEEYAQIKKDNAGVKSGIGVSYSFIEGEGARMVTVFGNSPAYKAGLRSGDTVTGATDGSGVEYQFKTASDFTQFMEARSTGEKFTLTDGSADFTMSKEEYAASYTFMATRDTAWEYVSSADGSGFALVENGAEAKKFLPADAAYISLAQFYGSAAAEFGYLVEKFNAEKCKTLILDLRNNGGGYVSVMQDIAGYFTSALSDKKHVAMTAKYKNGKEQTEYCAKYSAEKAVSSDTKVYVLANSGTASASEALIGVLVSYGVLDYKNIFLSDFSKDYLDFAGAGAKTKQSYGKGIMQSTFTNIFTGEAIKLTTAKIYWANGKCIHEVGLTQSDGCRLAPAQWSATKDEAELKYVVNAISAD